MTPKEKAAELINKMYYTVNGSPSSTEAKAQALIAVDEIQKAIRYTDAKSDLGYAGYWNSVKTEIEKL